MATPRALDAVDTTVETVRRFNRFYTQRIGVLGDGHLDSPFSLTEVRVLYELAHADPRSATEIGKALALDPGYMSRILRRFLDEGLIKKRRADDDGRRSLLSLTDKGKKAFAQLDTRASAEMSALLESVPFAEHNRLVGAMQTIESLLGAGPPDLKASGPVILRPHRPGDMGWVVARHGAVYASEYGWDATFEALVAEIVARFLRDHDPSRERCWIAERDGVNVASVFLVAHARTVAKLRLLLVEPCARGLGLGTRLVDECVRFATEAGYKKLILWTNHVLEDARRIYQRAGFHITAKEAHHSFGHDLIGETWALSLRPARSGARARA